MRSYRVREHAARGARPKCNFAAGARRAWASPRASGRRASLGSPKANFSRSEKRLNEVEQPWVVVTFSRTTLIAGAGRPRALKIFDFKSTLRNAKLSPASKRDRARTALKMFHFQSLRIETK